MKLTIEYTRRRTITERATVELDEHQIEMANLKFGQDLTEDPSIENWVFFIAPKVWTPDVSWPETEKSFRAEWKP